MFLGDSKVMKPINKHEIYRELQRELEEKKLQVDAVLFNKDFLKIEYNATNDWIYSNWIGYQTEGSVVEGCEAILHYMSRLNCSKVLNDNTEVVGIWTPAAAWVGNEWFPRMKNAGLQKFAWIYSPSAMSQVSTDVAIDNTPSPTFIKTFLSKNEAEEWLRM